MALQQLNFNIYNIIIIVGILHGILFSLILLINKKLKSKTNIFLTFTILSLCLSNLQYWFIDTEIISRFKYVNNDLLFIPFEFLILPFFYLFIKSFINRQISKKEKIYLFTPFICCIFYLLTRNLINSNVTITFLNTIVEYISILFSVLIIFLIFRLINIHKKSYSKDILSTVFIKIKWLERILYLGLILCILWFISLNLFKDFFPKGYYIYYPLWIGMLILVYWIGYTSITQNHIYKERTEIRNLNTSKTKATSTKKSNVKLYKEITNWIIENKTYLNPNLNLNIITKEFNISNGYLSQILNANGNHNFNDYINLLRVKEVERMLKDKEYNSYTLLAIGLEAGFSSKSSFYTVFKKITNKTQNEYKKLVQNN